MRGSRNKMFEEIINRMAEQAKKHFPHDERIPLLKEKALKEDEQALSTLYELSNGRNQPIKINLR